MPKKSPGSSGIRAAFITCRAFPQITEDDLLAAKACEQVGISVEARMWEDKSAPWDSFATMILRSPWNYYRRAEDFAAWVRGHSKALLNPAGPVLWNINKSYLKELAEKGVPIVPTLWMTNSLDINLEAAARDLDSKFLVIKPPISADGHRTHRVDPKNPDESLKQFRNGDIIMIQPYLDEVEKAGEKSLVYLGGEFSHAVRKVPAKGDFRVQEKYGGKIEPASADRGENDLAEKVLKLAPGPLLYARVDLMPSAMGPLLSELEVIEPSLYFKYDKKAPARFAEALKRRI